MKTKLLSIFAAAVMISATTFTITSCRSSSSGDNIERPDVNDKDLDPVDYENGANALSIEQLNELIMNADDLTPGQAVGALKMLNTQVNKSEGAKRDETMRQFVDLYGILLDIHGDNMKKAIKRLKDKSGVDLETIYADFAATLNVGDETGGGTEDGDVAEEAPKTEVATDDNSEKVEEPTATPDETKPNSTEPTTTEPEATISTVGD